MNEDKCFFKSKNRFLWVTLRMYYATAQTFISLIQRKRTMKNSLWIKKSFFWPYSNALCLIQRHFSRFKYNAGKKLRNNLFNFIISEWRQMFLQINEKISVSHITYVLCDCADIYFFNSKKKKNSQEISLTVEQCINLFDSKTFIF